MKWLGGTLFVAAAAALTGAMVLPAGEVLLIGGVPAALGGALLWRSGPRKEPPVPVPPPDLQERLAAAESALAALHSDVADLKTDRDFYRQLYAPAEDAHRSDDRVLGR